MATIKTKYSLGDTVYCLDSRGSIRERKVMGIRTQELFGAGQKTMYSFVKDNANTQDYLQLGDPIYQGNDFFWISEEHIYDNIKELLNTHTVENI